VGISLVCMYVCIMGGPHLAPALRPSLICCVSPFSVNPLLISHFKLNLGLCLGGCHNSHLVS
jgi:hypothetical protein